MHGKHPSQTSLSNQIITFTFKDGGRKYFQWLEKRVLNSYSNIFFGQNNISNSATRQFRFQFDNLFLIRKYDIFAFELFKLLTNEQRQTNDT